MKRTPKNGKTLNENDSGHFNSFFRWQKLHSLLKNWERGMLIRSVFLGRILYWNIRIVLHLHCTIDNTIFCMKKIILNILNIDHWLIFTAQTASPEYPLQSSLNCLSLPMLYHVVEYLTPLWFAFCPSCPLYRFY